ncbi:DUF2470 domain-containing protein [Streptomyces sp. URMC 123]|uniref:DUF2470 domain-containing protein n=1 Tax=Streptomyces sp. URMC 123 TaxID=3423403 RepID=UPI003F1CC052
MPSAAERTRTLVQSTCSAVVLIPGMDAAFPGARPDQLMPEVRSVGPDGEVFLVLPADSPAVRAATHAQDDELAAVLELTDVAPVAVPHRVRGRARLAGWLTSVPEVAEPGRMLLRLELGEAYIEDLWGAEAVEPEDFARASADPLVEHEAELLQHLHSAHADQVRGLCALLGEHGGEQARDTGRAEHAEPGRDTEHGGLWGRDTGAAGSVVDAFASVVPLALDRFGLRVRFVHAERDGFLDARFEFPRPVRDIAGLRKEMHRLFEAAAHQD